MCLVLNLSIVQLHASTKRPEKPNVILLLTDDFGQQDIGCYDLDNSIPYETPFLDSLSKKGVMFTQAYSPAPTCAPSRSAILSGLHPARTNLTHVSGGILPVPGNFKHSANITPYYKGHSSVSSNGLAKVLKANGYLTGHAGKWHMQDPSSKYAPPQGFDYTASNRGATITTPDRSKIFASTEPSNPYQLDANGFPQHDNLDDAIKFLKIANEQDKPFFLYWCTFLVHAPVHTRSRELLEKYCEKMNVPFPKDAKTPPITKSEDGQKNPYYGAMVEMLDYYCSQLYKYLLETEDPRWKGHKLYENTYIIFSSDNGGMEGSTERYTDNFPFQKGKISAMEGGIRVPLFIIGPNIPAGVTSDVLVNGLDFYPTIMSWTKSKVPEGKRFDGLDLSNFLVKNPKDASLIKDKNNKVRDTMLWHFPNASAQESAIRIGDYKLVRNYGTKPELELFRLYDSQKKANLDISEETNLAEKMPEKTAEMNKVLTKILAEMDADEPYLNPNAVQAPATKKNVPSVASHEVKGDAVEFVLKGNGAKIIRADLIYTTSDADPKHPWKRVKRIDLSGNKASVTLPAKTTYYYLNLIDENNFLVCYPQILDENNMRLTEKLSKEKALKTPLVATANTATKAKKKKN